MATRRRKRQSKGVTNLVEEENDVNSDGQNDTVSTRKQIVGTDEDAPKKISEKEQEEEQDEQDPQMDTVIEVKGSAATVTVSWDEKKEEEELGNKEKGTNGSDQMMEMEEQIISSAGAVGPTEDAPPEGTEGKKQQEVQEEPGVKGKRKKSSTAETSPSKKTKHINDGFCAFVGNLNNSKKIQEVRDSLANYFMTQSLLVQDIRVDKSKKHAHVDLASEMDLNKALTLDGEMVLDKPMKIAKAKVKSEDKVKVKVKATPEDKKDARDARCLFLKNVPYNATKEDIMKIFHKAVTVRFPGGAESPKKGIAFVEFQNKGIAEKVRQKKRVAKIQGRVLIVDSVGARNVPKVTEADSDNNNNTKAEAPPNNTLFVKSLSLKAKENHLKKVFQKAVSIKIPLSKGKSRGLAFVEFATVAEAEKALQSSKDVKILKKAIKVEFCEIREERENRKVLSKTLMVVGLAEKTTAETLKSAFEGAVSARVIAEKETGVSRRFGFVDFESEENAKAVKEAMEDCEIDGSKVTVIYAKPKTEKSPTGGRRDSAGRPDGAPAGRGAAKGGRGSRGGKGRGAGTPQGAAKGVKNKA
uniref:nucleolin-like n=1 Tax=Semicossyphus pulcher TaxID=241346 RepID=UPI0037E8FA9D